MKTILSLFSCLLIISFISAQDAPTSIFVPLQHKILSEDIDQKPDEIAHREVAFHSRYIHDRLDSLHYYLWDSLGLQWVLNQRTFYVSDDKNLITQETTLQWDTIEWVNSQRYEYTYDDQQNLTLTVNKVWDGNDWINVEQFIETYDPHNNKLKDEQQSWTGTDWSPTVKQEFTFDADDHLTLRISSHWTGTAWEGVFKFELMYDIDGHKVQQLGYVNNAGWQHTQKITFFYDENNDNIRQDLQSYTNGSYQDYLRYLQAFDGHHNRILLQKQKPQSKAFWEDIERYVYTFDGYDNLTSQLYQTSYIGHWFNQYQFLVTNDERENILSVLFQTWSSVAPEENGEWLNQDSMQYYYTLATATHYMSEISPLEIFPNPVTTSLQIHWSDNDIDKVAMDIYSSTGIHVMKSSINPLDNKALDISQLVPGEYYIMIKTREGISIQKFVKL